MWGGDAAPLIYRGFEVRHKAGPLIEEVASFHEKQPSLPQIRQKVSA